MMSFYQGILRRIDNSTITGYRVKCGIASGTSETHNGLVWESDANYAKSGRDFFSYPSTVEVRDTAWPEFFRKVTYAATNGGATVYEFPLKNGTYTLLMHLFHPDQSDAARTATLTVNGQSLLSNYDYRAENYRRSAFHKSFTVNVSNNLLRLEYTNVTSYPPISGIEIFPAGQATSLPLALATQFGEPIFDNTYSIAGAFDNNSATAYASNALNNGKVGYDLGSAKQITQVQFRPPSGFSGRVTGGRFRGSNSRFTGYVDLYTIPSSQAVNALQTAPITDTTPYRYFRYEGAAGSYTHMADIIVTTA
jgi:hypothetical protein